MPTATAVSAAPTAKRVRGGGVTGVIVGGALAIIGAVGGVLPMMQRRSPCLYSITPPAEFAQKYLEGITSTGPELSLLPFGAQCSYVATSTGEIAMSVIPLWPSVLILTGGVLLLAGAVSLVLSYRRHR